MSLITSCPVAAPTPKFVWGQREEKIFWAKRKERKEKKRKEKKRKEKKRKEKKRKEKKRKEKKRKEKKKENGKMHFCMLKFT